MEVRTLEEICPLIARLPVHRTDRGYERTSSKRLEEQDIPGQSQADPEGRCGAFCLRERPALWRQYLLEGDQEVPYADGFRKRVAFYLDCYFAMSH